MEKLSEIQRKLKAPKGQFNEFGKYNYRSCEDILEAVKPLLNGCQLTISDRIVQFGNRYYVEATALFVDGDKGVHVTAYAREQESKKGMDESQITGSASSYARKYALNGLFLIDDTKDADTMDNTKKELPKKEYGQTPKTEPKKSPSAGLPGSTDLSEKQWKLMKDIALEKQGLNEDELVHMVKWLAQKNDLPPRHWKIAKMVIEDFDNSFKAYNEFMAGANQAELDFPV